MANAAQALSLDDRIAEFDAMFEEDDPSVTVPVSNDQEDNVVHAMQELLLKHENTNVNRVEDPDLVRVLRELRTLGHSNIADVFECEEVMTYIGQDENEKDIYRNDTKLRVRNICELPREVSACIQSVKVTSRADGETVEVKMYDKQVSLDKLMRFHGAYMRDNEQNGNKSEGIMDLLMSSIGANGLPVIEDNDA